MSAVLIAAARSAPSGASTAGNGTSALSGDAVQRIAKTLFDYPISKTDAEAVAQSSASGLKAWRSIGALHLPPASPPFDYDSICAEAERLARDDP